MESCFCLLDSLLIVLKYSQRAFGGGGQFLYVVYTSLPISIVFPNPTSTKPVYPIRSSSCLLCSVESFVTHISCSPTHTQLL